MHLTFLAVGSRGDLQPYLALAEGFQRAGHRVRLATHAVFQELVESRGLEFALLSMNPQEMLKKEAGQAWLAAGSNPIRFFQQMNRAFRPLIYQLLTDCWNVCQGTDAILLSPLAAGAYSVAEKLGVPCALGSLQPGFPTRAFASPYAPALPLGPLYNRLSYELVRLPKRFFGRSFWNGINEWRKEFLGLPPFSADELIAQADSGKLPLLYGFSPAVVPPPTDWPAWVHVTGYWFLDQPPTWQPPADLVAFLQAGPPPVYVGFGSMAGSDPQQATETVLRALQQSGQRGILLTGWGGLSRAALPESVFVVDSIPHDWLFPQVAAVVHHGGAGTTAAGLRAGVPSILVPFFGDQPYWGRRVAELGVGPHAIPQKQLTAERLAGAIRLATSDRAMQERATALGQRIRDEDGIGQACALLENWWAQQKPAPTPGYRLQVAG